MSYTRAYPGRRTHSEAVEFDTTIDGRDALIGFTRFTVGGYSRDGEDADGRRGWWRFEYEDDTDNITLAFYDDDANLLTPTPIKQLSKELAATVDAAIEKYLADHEPADLTDGEPDYDDIDD